MEIEPVEDKTALTEFHELEVTARLVDHLALPADPIEERLPLLDPSTPEAGERTLLRLGRDRGRPVGTFELVLPTMDNLTAGSVEVRVHPDERRRGYGRALLGAALDELTELGRSRAFFEAPSPHPDGPAPAARLLREVGARPVLTEVRRLLDLREQSPAPPPDPPAGYRLVQWIDEVPEELVDDMAYLMHRMSTDVPLGEMDWEPEVWDAARYREREAAAVARGRTRIATLVVHEVSGKAAGFTDIGVSRVAPETAYQWETLVDRDFRGHGLGLVLKAHNHRLLARCSPLTRWLNTWNAESNAHMIAINEALGYRPVEVWTEWQLDR